MSMELRLIIKLILGALCAGLVFLGPADRLYDLYGFGLNKTLRVLILSVMLAYFLVTGLRFTRHGFIFGRFVLLFLFIAFIYCFYSPSLSTSFVSFSKALLWTLASVCTYRLRLYGHITDRFLYFSVCLAIPLACFFSLFAKFFGGLETSQNVGAYGLIWFFPLLMLSAKGSTNVKGFMVGLIFVTLLIVLKRGAIIAFVAGWCLYLFVDYKTRTNIREKLSYTFFLMVSISFSLIAVYFLQDTLYQRFVEDPTQRDAFYELLFEHWYYADITEFVFGFGSLSVNTFTAYYFGTDGLYAHSDWFQMLHDYGLVGVVVMLYFYYTLVKIFMNSARKHSNHSKLLAYAIGAMVCINIYSGQMFTPNTLLFGMFIGLCSADIKIISKREAN